MSSPRLTKTGFATFATSLALAMLSSCSPATISTVRVKNVSGQKITGGELDVCRQRFTLPPLEPEGTASFTFKGSFDSAYRLQVDLESAHSVAGEVGYVTRGLRFDDELLIYENRIALGTRAVQTP